MSVEDSLNNQVIFMFLVPCLLYAAAEYLQRLSRKVSLGSDAGLPYMHTTTGPCGATRMHNINSAKARRVLNCNPCI